MGLVMMPKMIEIFGKVASATSKSNFGGPAGGEALERASLPMAGENQRTKREVKFSSERVGTYANMMQL